MEYRRVTLTVLISLLMAVAIQSGFLLQKPSQNKFRSIGEDYGEMFQTVVSNYVDPLDEKKLFFKTMDSLINHDEFSHFLTGSSYEKLNEKLDGQSAQIGIEFIYKRSYLEVTNVVPNSPAAGKIFINDQILSVNNKVIEEMDYGNLLNQLRGEAESEIVFAVLRSRSNVEEKITIKRKILPRNPLKFSFCFEENKLGYIYIEFFSDTTSSYFQREYERLKAEGILGLILDFRGNPGGALSSAVNFCDLFLKKKLIVAMIGNVNGKYNQEELFYANYSQLVDDLPIVILIDRETASASELITGCLKDHQLAYVIGEKSYGKGSAQTLYSFQSPIFGNFGIRLTTSRFYTPAGYEASPKISIAQRGVEPNLVIDQGFQGDFIKRVNFFNRSWGKFNDAIIRGKSIQDAVAFSGYFDDLSIDVSLQSAIEYLREKVKN